MCLQNKNNYQKKLVPKSLSLFCHFQSRPHLYFFYWLGMTRSTTLISFLLVLRLEEAGLSENVLDSALSAFILEVVARHGEPSNRLCNKVRSEHQFIHVDIFYHHDI